ncbi:phosphatase PAP2 family protein [Methylobacterium pseudosasicola]|uniref:Undecaprenyl-diphosphatase n=1 Tax=Methylobacterium pseudosasicola TaxID=582667 RepID=A0A1I4VPR2_9HYPH|nr:phosphatase PAP2 family protein [Methylobacterium pseudosasicola]SFN03301.1 undecaprenyl-diphosphatase [Methylobacterium pseudosasicola]
MLCAPADRTDIHITNGKISKINWLLNVIASFLLFCCSYLLSIKADLFDRPIVRFVNRFTNINYTVDNFLFALDNYPTFGGVILLCFVWYVLSNLNNTYLKARVIIAVLSASTAGLISRFLQHTLQTHPRPFYDTALKFNIPSVHSQAPLNTWHSYPSDHAVVLFGLTLAVYIGNRKLGLKLAIWISLVEFARIYVGAHYPTDIIGGGALALCLVWFSQNHTFVLLSLKFGKVLKISKGSWYAISFFLSYQIATLFSDIRSIISFNALTTAISSYFN